MRVRRLCIIVGALFTVACASASASPPGFLGAWTSTDPVDGSTQRLGIGGGPGASAHVQLFDNVASSCGEPYGSATGSGVGTIARDTLTVTLKVTCHNGNFVEPTPVKYTLNPDGTLTDSFEAVWSRP